MQIRDLSHLPQHEARRKYVYLAHRIYAEQFHKNFFIRDPRPEYYLKYELIAFWEGRIQEFHGWEDPLGQVAEWIVDQVKGFINWFWTNIMEPGIDAIVGSFEWLWNQARDYASSAYAYASLIWDKIRNIGSEIYNQCRSALNIVWSWLTQLYNNYISPAISVAKSYLASLISEARSVAQSAVNWAHQAYNQISNAWSNIVETVSGKFEALSQQMAALPQAIASAFQSAVSYIWEVIKIASAKAAEGLVCLKNSVVQRIWGALEWFRSLLGNLFRSAIDFILKGLDTISNAIKKGSVAPAYNMLFTYAASGLAMASLVSALGTKVMGTGIEVGEIGHYLQDLLKPSEVKSLVLGTALGIAVATPLRYYYKAKFTPEIPTITEAREMLWRGVLSEEEFREVVRKHGFGGKFEKGFVELTKALPSPSDLVQFVVKECFPLEKLPEAPKQFVEAMKKHGYDELWCRAYWEAHWKLPSFEQLQEAFFRGIINLDEFRKYIVWHDYKPTPRPGISKSDVDIMNELIYKLPDKLDARWMLRWGIITKEEFKQIISWRGYHPDWLDKVYEGEYWNLLLDERTAVKSAITALYEMGWCDETQLRQILKEIRYIDDEINFLVRAANFRRTKEIIEAQIAAVKWQFRLGQITQEQFRAKLAEIIKVPEVLDAVYYAEIARMKEVGRENPEEKVREFGRGVVIARFADGLITEVELVQELKSLGYSEAQIERIKIYAKLKRDYEFAKDVLSALRTAWWRRRIDDTRFIELAKTYGIPEEKIKQELSLLKLKLGVGAEEPLPEHLRPRKPTKSDILRWLKNGLITEQEARSMLLDLGYEPHVVDLYIKEITGGG